MIEITRFFSPEAVRALGWTILHSLWQSVLIALVAALLVYLFRRQAPQIRYVAALCALFGVLAAAVTTFVLHYQPWAPADDGFPGYAFVEPRVYAPSGWLDELPEPEFAVMTAADFLHRHLPLIVTVWMMGVFLFSLRMLAQWTWLQRLRYGYSRPVAGQWQERLRMLSAQMGVAEPVALRESFRIYTPMVMGALKPVILLPVGLLTQLPPDQVESVLIHELAHIRRHDYLVNLLQTLVEIIFFFNPAVWWISSLVRAEREHCCDDWAVNLIGDEEAFVRTLASLEEYRAQHAGLAPALTGARGSVLGRIQRLLYGEPALALPYRLFWGGALVVLLSLAAAFQPPSPSDEEEGAFWPEEEPMDFPEEVFIEPLEIPADTVPPAGSAAEKARKELEAAYQARASELENRMLELSRRQMEKHHEIAAIQTGINNRQLEINKRQNLLVRERLAQERELVVKMNALRAQIMERVREAAALERAYDREADKDRPDAKRLDELKGAVRDMQQKERELEQQMRRLEEKQEQIALEAERVEEELRGSVSVAEKDHELQINGKEKELLELEEQMLKLQQEMEALQFEFEQKLRELERREEK